MPEPAPAAHRSLLVLRHERFEHLGYFAEILNDLHIPFVYSDLNDKLDLGSARRPDRHGRPPIRQRPRHVGRNAFHPTGDRRKGSRARHLPGRAVDRQSAGRSTSTAIAKRRSAGRRSISPKVRKMTRCSAACDSPSTFFHWHSETFTRPPGAELLAYSDKCRQQAFRYRDSVYGIQFHPEITPAMIVDWSAQPANCGDVDTLDAPIDPHAAATEPLARHILEGWLSTF